MPNLPPLLLLGLLLGGTALSGATPVNPAASPRVHEVLSYIEGLEARSTAKILSGQFTGYEGQLGRPLLEKIHAQTGQWPALVGVDYADHRKGAVSTRNQNRTAIDYWRAGGLVSVSAHLYNPANPNGGGMRDQGVDLDALLSPGTETNKRWLRELDQIAKGLGELQDAGVVVLWRPFHEMNGSWFWWGGKDPVSFARIWRHMFEYFTREKKLNNLLWVYSPNHGVNAQAYYPGDDLVDITGLDAYTNRVNPEGIQGYPEVAANKKPFGFTEFGPHGAHAPPGDFDYRHFLAGIRVHFTRCSFFLCWDEKWSPANNLYAREFYNDPLVVNRGGLPAGLAGDRSKP